MTMVFSAVCPYLIVMTADSAVTLDFTDHREYKTGRKSYYFPGVGGVMTWGARDHNRIGEFLDRQRISPERHSIDDLAHLVYQYISEEYRPQELNLDDVGYHVAGFDEAENARLYHVFWGFDQPKRPEQIIQEFKWNDHSPPNSGLTLLYNGRNDLAHVVVYTLFNQITSGNSTRFDLATPLGLVCFSDFVVRFASEITPEVAPPFITYLISPRNEATWIKNDNLRPISQDKVAKMLSDLGC